MIIDITNEVYTRLKTELSDITVLQSYPETDASFPCVSVEEFNNTDAMEHADSSGKKYVNGGLEINIFSNDLENKVSIVKNIRGRVDAILSDEYKMDRNFADAIPNYLNTKIYRYVMRYSYVIDVNKKIYRG